jgi:hypothetical protein
MTHLFHRVAHLLRAFRPAAEAIRGPVYVASQRPEIQAAARAWRDRLASARIGSKYDSSLETTVSAPLTASELDAFEAALVHQLASARAHVPEAAIFTDFGMEACLYVSGAASDAGIDKFEYWGWCSRMRILPTQVAFELDSYRSFNWTTVWTNPAETPTNSA